MSEVSRSTLKTYFNRGDKPTEAQFADLIDSSFNETLNVKSYGHDDTSAIQSAVNDASDNTIILLNSDSPFIVTSGITISSKTNVVIAGNGVIKFTATSSNNAHTIGPFGIVLDNCTNTGIKNIEFDVNSLAQGAVGFEDCDDCFFISNEVYGSDNIVQVAMLGGSRNKISYNIVRDSSGSATRGIYVGNTNAIERESDCYVSGNIVYNNTATGIAISCDDGIVEGNISYSNGGSGIIFTGSNGLSTKNILCTNNVSHSNTFHGIQSDVVYSSDDDLTKNILVSSNVCYSNELSGIFAVNTTGWTITGNRCFDNDNTGNGLAGIDAEIRCDNIHISNNSCYDTRSGVSRTQDSGITVRTNGGNIDNVTIAGNDCYNNISTNIELSTNSSFTINNILITSNNCYDSAYGLFITEATDGAVTKLLVNGNICTDNSNKDIRASVDNILQSSNVFDTSQDIVQSFTDGDTTPDVSTRRLWTTSNTSPTTITNMTGAQDYQEITIIFGDSNTTIDFTGTNLKGNSGSDWTPDTNDHMTGVYDGTNWYFDISDNT